MSIHVCGNVSVPVTKSPMLKERHVTGVFLRTHDMKRVLRRTAKLKRMPGRHVGRNVFDTHTVPCDVYVINSWFHLYGNICFSHHHSSWEHVSHI